MTPDQVLIAHLIKVLGLFTLMGIVWRGRAHLCWSFVAYLLTQLVCNVLFSFWPDRFFEQWFWILQQGLDDALKMGIAVELGFRIFQAFPGAQATARRVLFFLLVATSLALIGIPVASSYGDVLFEWQPRVLTGTIWLMNGLALLITWYRVPVHSYHKAILMGFVPYLLVFTTLLTLLGQHAWLFRVIQSADALAYMLLMSFWTWSAWKPETQPDVSAAVIRWLQPWRKVDGVRVAPTPGSTPAAPQALQPERA
jgi:hypothetical protein